MIKIFCCFFHGEYSRNYVKQLYESVKDNYHGSDELEFICYSEDEKVKADRVIMLPKKSRIKAHWCKLNFFNPMFGDQKPGDDIIVMDIDQMVCGDLTEMITYQCGPNDLVSYESWWNRHKEKGNTITINGGWYKFKSGAHMYLWERFIRDPEYWQMYYYKAGTVHLPYYGEQNFVEDTVLKAKKNIAHLPGHWVTKWTNRLAENRKLEYKYQELFNQDYMILDDINPVIKIIHFTGKDNRIEDCNHHWRKSRWAAHIEEKSTGVGK